jgi:hypothetical protein
MSELMSNTPHPKEKRITSQEDTKGFESMKKCVTYGVINGPDSVVGIAIVYGLVGPGIESRWGEVFRTIPDRPWGPPSLLYNGYRVFPGGKERPWRDANPSPPSSAVFMNE